MVNYTYFDPATNGLNLDGMLADLEALAEGSVVILHACCHNPTGVDLGLADWAKVIDVVGRRQLVPFLDIAYQGFGENLEDDAVAVRCLPSPACPSWWPAPSPSPLAVRRARWRPDHGHRQQERNRTGAIAAQARYPHQLLNPPTHGAKVVAAVLTNPELYAQWEEELAEMRDRIRDMRAALVEKLQAAGVEQDVSLSNVKWHVLLLRPEQESGSSPGRRVGIYAVGSGRICVAALNTSNIDAVATAMAAVMKG
ncbi:aminotransferase class I/II-fold pyridoxal phosphate-dependent enzyme [Halopseudomonas pachastrellae]|nr:aminotransferase class I/II-fold pyridoxal phosphate-dependent enzyme [Halopseudomonas pachastrellae]